MRTWYWGLSGQNYTWLIDGQVTLTHNVVGNLTDVLHPTGHTTSIGYDLGGRKDWMNDIDLGYWDYTYNRQGQLVSQTDARSKTTCLYYDGMERLVGKHLPSTTSCPAPGGYAVTYLYDESHGVTLDGTVNRSRGQLTRVFDVNYTKWFYYNDKGLLRKETISISGAPQNYTTSYGYDGYQRPSTVTYPDNEVVTTAYNSMGLQAKLSSTLGGDLVDGTVGVHAVTDAVSYDEAGRLRNLRFPQDGNLWQSYGYYPWTGTDAYGLSNSDSTGRLRLVYVGTNPYWGDKYGSHYSYDSHGNPTVFQEWVDNVTVTNATFGYDQQNRLTSGYGRQYGYDSAGRMTNYESAAQSFHPYRPHAMSPNWNNYGVDLNGNFVARVQNGVAQTLTWDHQNRLMSISGTGINESYLYDAEGQRIKKTSNGSATYYPNQFYEQYGGTNIDKYYYFNGQPIALRRNGGLYYLHQDQIGNMALVTSGGNRVDDQGFYAYGRLRQGIIGVERSFTGQQKDFGTGLIYFKARYYDPELGTFISPDTLVPDPTNLFDYNRYMYVRGNPISQT